MVETLYLAEIAVGFAGVPVWASSERSDAYTAYCIAPRSLVDAARSP